MTWFTILAFIRNKLNGKRWNSFHSPYLFRLFSYMGDEQVEFEQFDAIEGQRNNLLNNHTSLVRKDFGAGSTYSVRHRTSRINIIAKHALSLPFQCRCLARLVRLEKSNVIVEFGTSLGISTAYLQSGNPLASISTVEGDPALAKWAQSTFAALNMTNIKVIVSTFENFLETHDADISIIDILFLDGNHQSTALLHYYDKLKNRFSSNTIVIVDDIYWSKDMHDGWIKLINKPEVTQSVDCFRFGLLFFRKEFIDKEHHTLCLPMHSLFS